MPGMKLIRIAQVMKITTLRRATIYKYIKEGNFPRGIRLSGRPGEYGMIVWDEADIDRWIESKRQESITRSAP